MVGAETVRGRLYLLTKLSLIVCALLLLLWNLWPQRTWIEYQFASPDAARSYNWDKYWPTIGLGVPWPCYYEIFERLRWGSLCSDAALAIAILGIVPALIQWWIWRRLYQVHLSTALVLVFVAAFLLYANMYPGLDADAWNRRLREISTAWFPVSILLWWL